MLTEGTLIAPSVLSADFTRLGEELDSISDADYVHYDVMDGHFVPNLSFGTAVLSQVKAATSLPIDVHLMVANPEECARWYLEAGADAVSFHWEAQTHAARLVSLIHDAGARAGVALTPATPVSVLEAIIDELDLVLIMSVNPGFGGQRFLEGTIGKLRTLRALCTSHGVRPLVEVDGGIGASNAGVVCAAGANLLVAGSSIFGTTDRAAAIAKIRTAGDLGLAREA